MALPAEKAGSHNGSDPERIVKDELDDESLEMDAVEEKKLKRELLLDLYVSEELNMQHCRQN